MLYGTLLPRYLAVGVLALAAGEPVDLSTCDRLVAKGNGHVCYWLTDELMTRDEAQARCVALGRHLLTVTSESENEAVQSLMEERLQENAAVWLAATETYTTWKWLNGEETLYQGCHADRPSKPDLSVRAVFDDNNAANCTNYCRQKGYKYAGVQAAISCWCGDSFGEYGRSTGCNMLCPDDTDMLCGGKEASDVYAVYGLTSDWFSGQPNNHLAYQTCAVTDSENRFEWNDVKCSERQSAICMVANSSAQCEAHDHVTVGNRCYVISLVSESWFEARLRCVRSLGGELAIFDSTVTSRLVSAYIRGQDYGRRAYWLGLTRTVWSWASDDAMLFTRWRGGQPNGHTQRCASVVNPGGSWEDVACEARSAYICQRDNSTAVKVTTTSRRPPTTTQALINTTVVMTTVPVTSPPTTTLVTTKAPFEFTDGIIAAIVSSAAVLVLIVAIAISCLICRKSRQKKDDANVHPDEQTPSYNYGADNAATATDFNDDDNNGDIERQSNNTKPNASEELSEDVKRHSQPPDVVPK